MAIIKPFWSLTGASIVNNAYSSSFQPLSETHLWARIDYNLDGLTSMTFVLWGSTLGNNPFSSDDTAPIYRTTEDSINKLVQIGPLNNNLFSPMFTSFGWGTGPVQGEAPGDGAAAYGVDITAWPMPCPIAGFPYMFVSVLTEGTANANDNFTMDLITTSV